MSPYHVMPPYQSMQINCSVPSMSPVAAYRLSNPYISSSGVNDNDLCYTVQSSAAQPIPSVSNVFPPKSIQFVPTTVPNEGPHKQQPEPRHPNHPPKSKLQVLGDNLSQYSGTSSRRSTKQRQLKLELQLLDEGGEFRNRKKPADASICVNDTS